MTIAIPTYKVVVTMERKSGIEKDRVMNTWVYSAPSSSPATGDFTAWILNYKAFLDDMHLYYANCMSGAPGAISVDFTRLTTNAPPPGTGLGPPAFHGVTEMTAPITQGLPAETAAVVTLDGTSITDSEEGAGGTRPAARKRNRKYIGPLATTALGTMATILESNFATAFRDELVQRTISRLVTNMASSGWGLQAFSKVNWATAPPHSIWVDDAPDVQRRRGIDPSTKTTQPVPGSLLELVKEQYRAVGRVLEDDGVGNFTSRPL